MYTCPLPQEEIQPCGPFSSPSPFLPSFSLHFLASFFSQSSFWQNGQLAPWVDKPQRRKTKYKEPTGSRSNADARPAMCRLGAEKAVATCHPAVSENPLQILIGRTDDDPPPLK
ncbi:unnamed protein product [Ixodes persulcatus]